MIVLKSCITPIGKDQMRDALVTVSKPFVLLHVMFLILIVQLWHCLADSLSYSFSFSVIISCIGKEPYYMLSNYDYFLSSSLQECCENFYNWDLYSCTGTTPALTNGEYYL